MFAEVLSALRFQTIKKERNGETMFNEIKETVTRLALEKIQLAETLIGSGQGELKMNYVVNLIIDELKKLPLPLYIRIFLGLFQFAFKSEIREQVQQIFDEAKAVQGA